HSVQMMKHLRGAAEERGRTIVIVLHDINFASHYADHICAVKHGRVVEFGTPAEIMTDTLLSRVFETPVKDIDGPDGALACYYWAEPTGCGEQYDPPQSMAWTPSVNTTRTPSATTT